MESDSIPPSSTSSSAAWRIRSRLSGAREVAAIDKAYGVRLSYAVNLHCMGEERMKAITQSEFGTPEVLKLEEVARPEPAEDEVLVRVHAASVNPFDWHVMTGVPYLARIETGWRKPKTGRLGVDFAGVVDALGAKVTRFEPGQEVFGGRSGSLAELVPVREERGVAQKPAGVSFEQAASIGIAGGTALQGLRK